MHGTNLQAMTSLEAALLNCTSTCLQRPCRSVIGIAYKDNDVLLMVMWQELQTRLVFMSRT